MKPYTRILVPLLVALVAGTPSWAWAEKVKEEPSKAAKPHALDEFEGEVEGQKKHKDEGPGRDERECCGSSEENFWGLLIELSLRSGGLLFGSASEDRAIYDGNYWQARFSDYPYARSGEGLYSSSAGSRTAVDFGAHYFSGDDDLVGIGYRGRWLPTGAVSLEGRFTRLGENLGSGDDLTLYSVLLNYQRVRLERWTLWWGIGVKGLSGNHTHNGIAFDVGTELFPVRPWSLRIDYLAGWINGVYVPEFTGTVNVHANRFALFAGYQRWSAGDAHIGGPITGVKAFF